MKKRTPPISAEDRQLLDEALKGTKPIVHDKVNLRQQRPAPKIPKHQPIPEEPFPHFQRDPVEQVLGEQALEFSRNGVNPRELKRLRQGLFAVEATLDLHGATADEAEQKLLQLLQRCQQQQIRFIRVIHGQGLSRGSAYPVLKNLVNQLLRSHPLILAFCTCLPSHGGRGAVNVLLKRQL